MSNDRNQKKLAAGEAGGNSEEEAMAESGIRELLDRGVSIEVLRAALAKMETAPRAIEAGGEGLERGLSLAKVPSAVEAGDPEVPRELSLVHRSVAEALVPVKRPDNLARFAEIYGGRDAAYLEEFFARPDMAVHKKYFDESFSGMLMPDARRQRPECLLYQRELAKAACLGEEAVKKLRAKFDRHRYYMGPNEIQAFLSDCFKKSLREGKRCQEDESIVQFLGGDEDKLDAAELALERALATSGINNFYINSAIPSLAIWRMLRSGRLQRDFGISNADFFNKINEYWCDNINGCLKCAEFGDMGIRFLEKLYPADSDFCRAVLEEMKKITRDLLPVLNVVRANDPNGYTSNQNDYEWWGHHLGLGVFEREKPIMSTLPESEGMNAFGEDLFEGEVARIEKEKFVAKGKERVFGRDVYSGGFLVRSAEQEYRNCNALARPEEYPLYYVLVQHKRYTANLDNELKSTERIMVNLRALLGGIVTENHYYKSLMEDFETLARLKDTKPTSFLGKMSRGRKADKEIAELEEKMMLAYKRFREDIVGYFRRGGWEQSVRHYTTEAPSWLYGISEDKLSEFLPPSFDQGRFLDMENLAGNLEIHFHEAFDKEKTRKEQEKSRYAETYLKYRAELDELIASGVEIPAGKMKEMEL